MLKRIYIALLEKSADFKISDFLIFTQTLLFPIQFEEFICTHTIDEEYIFGDTDVILDNNYIIGHSHYQYKIERNGYSLLNPGSVGQNRQFINEINFMIYDTTTSDVDFRSALYEVDTIINQMEKMDYPDICLNYYRNKPQK